MKKSISTTIRLLVAVYLVMQFGACDNLLNSSNKENLLSVNNDLKELNQRLEIVNQSIVFDSIKSKDSGSAVLKGTEDPSDDFYHVANVRSPELEDGQKLSATSIEIRDQRVFVSYHLNGSDYHGAIEIIDLKADDEKMLQSNVSFKDLDVNGLEISSNGKNLWFTGGRLIKKSEPEMEGHNGAMAGEVKIEGNVFRNDYLKIKPLPSFSGNAIVEFQQNLYVATGATGGGFFELDKGDFSIKKQFDKEYAKFIDQRRDDIIGLSLSEKGNATFQMMDFKKDEIQDSYDTGLTVVPVNGKNVIEQFASVTYAALGDHGVKGYKFEGEQNHLLYEYKADGEDVASAVSADDKYVYITNGTDGLYITTRPMNGKTEPKSVYQWNSEMGSANFVKTNGKYIIVAKGTDGLNILRKGK